MMVKIIWRPRSSIPTGGSIHCERERMSVTDWMMVKIIWRPRSSIPTGGSIHCERERMYDGEDNLEAPIIDSY
jgi:hypothetical protein